MVFQCLKDVQESCSEAFLPWSVVAGQGVITSN